MVTIACLCAQWFRCVQLFVTPWTVACQAPLSIGFSQQEHWSGVLFPTPGNCPHPVIEPLPPALACRLFATEPLGKLGNISKHHLNTENA